MSKIIRVGILVIFIYFIHDYFRYSFLSGILSFARAVSLIYLIYLVVIYIKQNSISKNKDGYVEKDIAAGKPRHWTISIIALLSVIYFLREFLGRMSYSFFLFFDNLVKVDSSFSPVFMWGFLGLFVGLIYGSFVAWKKYRLDFKLNLIPLGIFLFIVFILIIVNDPFASKAINYTPPQAVVRTDSIINDSAQKFIINSWKTVNVTGKNRENFIRRKNNIASELEFKKNGKCYIKKNGIRSTMFFYTLSPDGRSLLLTNPKNLNESITIQIISIEKDELVITSEMYGNDTMLLKAKRVSK
jgi:hypothetical protein